MKKIITMTLAGLIVMSVYSIADGKRIYKKARYGSITSKQCRELYLSGILEIKNKNLDFDKNNILFKTQRISYVVPDQYSIIKKKCREVLMGPDDLPMKEMIKVLE